MAVLIKGNFFVVCYVNVQGDSDAALIEREVSGFGGDDIQKILNSYSKEYIRIMSNLSIPSHERVGMARKECNTRLRNYVKMKKGKGVQVDNQRVARSR